MIQTEQIHQLFEELGPASDDVAGVAQTGDNSWAVAYDDDTIVSFEFVAEQDKLVLSIDLGAAEESRRLAVYSALLSYNFLWRETGGVKMALGGDDLYQLFELNAVGLTLTDLRNVLGNFVEKARAFRSFVAGETAAEVAFGAPPGLRI